MEHYCVYTSFLEQGALLVGSCSANVAETLTQSSMKDHLLFLDDVYESGLLLKHSYFSSLLRAFSSDISLFASFILR
jgi:hypothetical protein